MSKKFFTTVDLRKNELQNIVIHKLDSAPANPNVDNPAPNFCAACNNIIIYIVSYLTRKQRKRDSNPQFWIWRPIFYH